jgi:FkbM family methyltransferase
MPISEDVIRVAIRLLLDREPLGPGEVTGFATRCADVGALRRELLGSEEFERLHPDLARAEHPAPVIVPIHDGLRVVVDLSDHAAGAAIARRAYEVNELEFVRRVVQAGQSVVDGGAHAGLFTVTMAARVGRTGRVHAFEPAARQLAWLEASVTESAVADRVSIHRAALADRAGAGELMAASRTFNPGAAWLRRAGQPVPPGHVGETVEAVALDGIAGLTRPVSFIRLDVEGAEALALRGAFRILAADRPVLLVEVHVDRLPLVSGETAASMLAELRALGYSAHLLGAAEAGPAISDLPACGTHAVVFLP